MSWQIQWKQFITSTMILLCQCDNQVLKQQQLQYVQKAKARFIVSVPLSSGTSTAEGCDRKIT